jgi:hypothetical protein
MVAVLGPCEALPYYIHTYIAQCGWQKLTTEYSVWNSLLFREFQIYNVVKLEPATEISGFENMPRVILYLHIYISYTDTKPFVKVRWKL